MNDGTTEVIEQGHEVVETRLGGSPEEELNLLIKGGELEMVVKNPAFQSREELSQAIIVSETVDHRITRLYSILNKMVQRGPQFQRAAMGVTQLISNLRNARDWMLNEEFKKSPQAIPNKSGVKIDF